MIEWDFEGMATFLTPEEGGREHLPYMGYFPSFRYPEFDDGMHFIARPVLGFKPDGVPYEAFEWLDRTVLFRFRFLNRDFYESLHRERLATGRRIELMEGKRTVAEGVVLRTRAEAPDVETEIERLLDDLKNGVSNADAKEVAAFLYHREWECAVDLLWASLSVAGVAVEPSDVDRLVDLARRVGMDLDRMARDYPLRRSS